MVSFQNGGTERVAFAIRIVLPFPAFIKCLSVVCTHPESCVSHLAAFGMFKVSLPWTFTDGNLPGSWKGCVGGRLNYLMLTAVVLDRAGRLTSTGQLMALHLQ